MSGENRSTTALDRLIDFELARGGDISPSRLARLRASPDHNAVERNRTILRCRPDLQEVPTARGSKFVPAGGAS